jgi:hypothetical protein
MEKDEIIVEMTPFIFEDGETYYFDIRKRHTNVYHNLFVHKKVVKVITRKTWFGLGATETETKTEMKCLNPNNAALVGIELHVKEIKNEIKDIIISNKAITKIKDWDGFVGDIPDEVKKALTRDSKLKDLGIK